MKKTVSRPEISGSMLFIFLLFTACQKSSPASNTGTGTGTGGTAGGGTGSSGNLLKTAISVEYDLSSGSPVRADSIVMHYSYDGQNRSTSIVEDLYALSPSNPQGVLSMADTTTYGYGGVTISLTRQNWAGSTHQGTLSTTYYLNASGTLADSSYQTAINYPGYGSTQVNKYGYDANGYLSTMKTYNVADGLEVFAAETFYHVSNGNTVSSNVVNPLLTDSTNYTFTSQGGAALANGIGDYISTRGITGHVNVNLPQTYTLILGPSSSTVALSYGFDSMNRIVSIIDQVAGLGLLGTNVYTYY